MPSHSLSADLVHQLVVKFRVPEIEVASMDKEQAVSLLQSLWVSETADRHEAQAAGELPLMPPCPAMGSRGERQDLSPKTRISREAMIEGDDRCARHDRRCR